MQHSGYLQTMSLKADKIQKVLLEAIKIHHFKKYSTITLPYYFPFSKEPLSLTLFKKGDSVFITDWGRAYSEVAKRLNKSKVRKMAKYFLRVNFESELKCNSHLVAKINSAQRFFDYLKVVSLVANSDMYPEIDKEYFKRYKKYSKKHRIFGKTESAQDFLNQLTEAIRVRYDERNGITVHTRFYFNDEACPMGLSLTKDGEQVKITDFGDFDGGRLFQRIEWLNDNVEKINDDILVFCKRFSCDYGNKTISLKVQKEQVIKGIFDFYELASILSEIGHFVVL